MAKQSAKSKGYRKVQSKKPYLSKKEIVWLCVIAAALIVAAIALFSYDDGALKVKDGAVVTDGDNWLIVNARRASSPRYFKVGEVGDIEGYTREKVPNPLDANLADYEYAADGEAVADTVHISANHYKPEVMINAVTTNIAGMGDYEIGEVQTAQVDDASVQYYIYSFEGYAPEEDEAASAEEEAHDEDEPEAEHEPNTFSKTASAYLACAQDGSVQISVARTADSPEALPDDETLTAFLLEAVQTVTLEK